MRRANPGQSAYDIRMRLEVEDGDGPPAFAVDAQKLHFFVGDSRRPGDVGVEDARIGAHGAVLHPVAAREGDARGRRARERKRRRRSVADGEKRGVREAAHGVLHVERRHRERRGGLGAGAQRVGGAVQVAAGVRVRGVEKDRLAGDAGRGGNRGLGLRHDAVFDFERVQRDEECRGFSVREGDAARFERIQDLPGFAVFEVSGDVGAQGRRDVNGGKADSQ